MDKTVILSCDQHKRLWSDKVKRLNTQDFSDYALQ